MPSNEFLVALWWVALVGVLIALGGCTIGRIAWSFDLYGEDEDWSVMFWIPSALIGGAALALLILAAGTLHGAGS